MKVALITVFHFAFSSLPGKDQSYSSVCTYIMILHEGEAQHRLLEG